MEKLCGEEVDVGEDAKANLLVLMDCNFPAPQETVGLEDPDRLEEETVHLAVTYMRKNGRKGEELPATRNRKWSLDQTKMMEVLPI